ncbi:LON peptidase N-terminal domain and ring finger 1, like isoform X1 [Electrophorus electricus]|uniref:LON peptidase N-terminal domain and ring finger 1, like n=1 Tax=Electrophorus electricus TaxID=8005 RepID=A0AAY5EPR2_ELEEL|nr:LON peptidase N-terminal domain and ring finger 1, like isoform X1 [Electrophorus electricus]
MSVQKPGQSSPLEERAGFFISAEREGACGAEDGVGHRRLVLLRADVLASDSRLKEAIGMFTAALRDERVRPEQLSTLVGSILRNFQKQAEERAPLGRESCARGSEPSEFDCPACRRFLGEPVTVACGHSYCRGCLQQGLLSKCKVCDEELETKPADFRLNVLLTGLVEKWFPEDIKQTKTVAEAEGLLSSRRFRQAVSLASELLESDSSNVRLRMCRAEAYHGLQCYDRALDDWTACLSVAPSLQGYFCKAKVLQEMGRLDESLQLFLQCLAVDESFQQAKQEVEGILHGLLSPTCGSIAGAGRDSTQKPSTQLLPETQQVLGQTSCVQKLSRPESLERSGLNRAHSLRVYGLGGAEKEGLKRVCSAPQLGDQEKGTLLKRKLSGTEAWPGLPSCHGNKHKRQGETATVAPMVTEETKVHRTVPRHLLDPTDFECSLCMRLFYAPVTTPCGHTFCKSCLQRCLDHSPQCPLCKESLKVYLARRTYSSTRLLENIIRQYLPQEYSGRHRLYTEETKELSDLQRSVPIFVCTMAYPTVPCPLHVFEPRYRLMVRRCMETGTRQFGMCIHDARKGFADYGCMLHIRSVHYLPDGRSVVDTIGGKRFHVLSRSMRDGYCTAHVEYLQDQRVVDEGELARLQELYDQVYSQARVWFHTLENRFRNQILQHFGPMPEREDDIQAPPNGPACCWWLLAVLPVDPRYQLSLLSMTTLKERLVKIQHILTYLQNTHSP